MPDQQIVIGPDGEIQPRVTELDVARVWVEEYKGRMNGTGNWTEVSYLRWGFVDNQPAAPLLLPSSLIPPEYDHKSQSFFTNITGFYREATIHPFNLTHPEVSHFFQHIHLPSLNASTREDNRAREKRGDVDWAGMNKWSMNVREREIEGNFSDWTWVKGGATLASNHSTIDYSFYGLHHLPNGTINLFALPDGMKIDIRNIPRLYPDHHNETSQIILLELEKELKTQQDNLMLSDVKPDGWSSSHSIANGSFNGDNLPTSHPPDVTSPSAWCNVR